MGRVRTGAMLLVVVAALACSGGDDSDAGGGGSGPASPDPPEIAELKAVVSRFMEAGRQGDAETLVGLFVEAPDTTALGAPRPRQFEFEVRDAWLDDPSTAGVTAYLQDTEIQDGKNEFLITYTLQRTDDAWKIASTQVRGFWEDDRDE